MAQQQPAKYQYVYTAGKAKILPVDEAPGNEEHPAEYNTGGYLPVKLSDTFKAGRYCVVRKLGWGHFSTVWLVRDSHLKRHSALKVVKSAGRYAETARDEIQLLSRVAAASPLHPGRQHVVSFMDSFSHEGPESTQHICIVFEPLGENLLALIERHRRKGVPRALVKIIAKQVLLGLEYLHEACDLVHTDIKPENILISIPDVEEYICTELVHSPSPTSRRVGVPPPKSRPSVSIPHAHRSRRQVQIFDSQPLGSPGSRSGGLGSHSGPNSYVSPVQMFHMAKYGVNGLSSSAPKVASALSTSAPRASLPTSSKSTPATAASSHANSPTSPPSTSSSSSSVSSTPFTAADSVSTPPTSLSNSFGSAMLSAHMHIHAPPPSPSADTNTARVPLPLSPSSATSLTPTAASPPLSSPPSDFPLPHLQTPALALPKPRPSAPPQISIKIADLGNATPSKKHFTEDIQTRQYRSPEAIIGRKDWGPRADIWSVACLVFELLTAEFLFDPQGQAEFTKDDDHMAQIIELLGDFALDVKIGGKYSHELFDSTGSLRYIKTLKPWPLKRVMTEKYLWKEADATVVCAFLEPMLAIDPRNRADAKDMLDHRWLEVSGVDDVVGDW
ncbi:kinase-like domain-containing protein [Mycena amicta]|nr:kinase-like domain-containing protein [Mycena amicta]